MNIPVSADEDNELQGEVIADTIHCHFSFFPDVPQMTFSVNSPHKPDKESQLNIAQKEV